MLLKKKIFTFCLFFILPILGFSQVMPIDSIALNEVIIKGNRLQIPFNSDIRNIQILDKKEIAQLPAKSLQEVLAFVAGLDVKQRGPFGTQTDIVLDGGSFEQTLILLNGVKISDVQTAHNSMNLPVPLEAIERIEVLKGPAARVYGVNALTGAINIVTIQSDKSFLKANSYIGSSFNQKDLRDGQGIYGGGGLQLTANYAKGNTNQLLSFGRDQYNGQRYNTASNHTKLFYQGNYQFNPQHALNVMGGYVYNKFGANGFYAAPNDLNAEEIVETAFFSIGTTHQLSHKFALRPRISNRYNEDDYRFYKDDLSKGRSKHYSNVIAAELNANWNTAIGDLGFGLESRSEQINSSNIGEHQRYNHGFYSEFKTDVLTHFKLHMGSYLNYNTVYGWQFFPGIDLAYVWSERWKIGFNVGTSQRLPSFTDLYLNQQPANMGNPNLNPEKAWQYEFSAQFKTEQLYLLGGYFYRDISNFIDWIRTANTMPYQANNTGDNRMHGFNILIGQNFKWNTNSRFNYKLKYNYLLPQSNSQNSISKYVLEHLNHQAILTLNYGYQKFNFNWNNRWIKRALNNAYLVSDIRLTYQLKQLQLYTDLNNVFNVTYKETAAVPLPKRWFSLGVRWALNGGF